jgi:membrane protein DedA with SNARE-associated domain
MGNPRLAYAIAGIRPLDLGSFLLAEILGALATAAVFGYLYPKIIKLGKWMEA